jgi:hypothetical protein
MNTNRISTACLSRTARLLVTCCLLLALVLGAFGLARAGVLAPPVVVDLQPDPGVHTAPVDASVSVTYDQDMNPATVNPQTFAVHARQTGWLTETLSVNSGTITLDPVNPFHVGELVQASATTGLHSLGGEAPLEPTVWQFNTAPWGGNAYFHPAQSWANAGNRDAALGDLDGDGDLDAVTSRCDEWITVLHNDGSASFTQAQQIALPVASCILAVRLGDLDGDGDLDAFLVNYNGTSEDRILLNNGDGTFSLSSEIVPSIYNVYGELGDLDGDGDLDVIVTAGGFDQGRIRTWMNDGAGGFTLGSEFDTGYEHTGVALGDLDGDGDLDALSTGWYGTYNKVWLNDGTGAFSEYQSIPLANTYTPLLGDLDGDGDLDVYFANLTIESTDLPDEVWLNDGLGNFTNSGQALDTAFGGIPALGDLDADGDLDVYVSGDFGQGALDEVWLNDGLGDFSLGYQVEENFAGGWVTLGDLDGDGNLDALSGDLNLYQYVFLNGDWTQAAKLHQPLATFSVQCPEQPDSFYLVGEVTTGWVDVPDLYRYDADTNSWTVLAPMPQPRRAAALACYGGKIYVAGGYYLTTFNSLFIYDIASDSWSQGAHLPNTVIGAALGAWDGKLYLAGGTRVLLDPYPPVDRVDVYDIATDTWAAGGGRPMPAATDFAASVQAGPYLYIAGGFVGDGVHLHDELQIYDMASDTWELGPPLTIPQFAGGLAINESRLYLLGGSDQAYYWNALDKVDVLELADLPGGAWAALGDPLPQVNIYPASACTNAIVGGEVWALGGGDATGTFYDTNLYHPAEPCLGNTFTFDLAPKSLPGEGKPGEVVTYTLAVTNTGDTPDAYSVLVTSTWEAEAPEVVGALDPGESVELQVTVEVPAGAFPDDTDIATVTVTSQGDDNQQDSAAITTTAREAYGVILDRDSLAQSTQPGGIVTYTLQLTNTGNVTDTFDLTYAGNEWAVTLPVMQTILAPFAGVDVIAIVAIPAGARGYETDGATITAASQGDLSQTDSSELTTTALPVYGVEFSAAEVALNGYPGEVVEYNLTLSNTGNFTDTFDLASTGNAWAVTLPVTQTTLAAGASLEVAVQVLVPMGVADGDQDSVTITATSQGDPIVTASGELTTTAVWMKVYMPFIKK